jgi:glycerophosphoryl diester phosphodiesterase
VFGDLRRNWRAALALHAFLRLATAAVAIPLLTAAFRWLLAASGDRVISNFDIAAFLLSPGGALLAAVAATSFILFSLAELAGFTHLAAEAGAGRRPTFAAALGFLARRRRALTVFAARLLGRVALLLLPAVAAAVIAWFVWLGEHDINYYLAEQPPEWRRAVWLAGLAGAVSAIAIARQLLRWLYVLPILAADPAATTGAALADSERLTHGRLWALLGPLAAWWLLVAACALVLIGIGVRTSAGLFDWAGMDIRRVLPAVGLCLSTSALAEFALTGIALAGQQFQLVRSYADAKGITRTGPPASSSAPRAGAIGFAGRAVAAVFAAAAVAAALSWLARTGSSSTCSDSRTARWWSCTTGISCASAPTRAPSAPCRAPISLASTSGAATAKPLPASIRRCWRRSSRSCAVAPASTWSSSTTSPTRNWRRRLPRSWCGRASSATP